MASYAKGQSGNPAGRRHGSRNKASLLCDQIGTDDAADIVKAMAQKAKQGDPECARVILSRVWQPRRGRGVKFTMPAISTPGDVVAAIAGITQQVAAGELSLEEGAMAVNMLEALRKAIETQELEARISALEEERERR